MRQTRQSCEGPTQVLFEFMANPQWLRGQRICLQCGRPTSDLWRRKQLPTPVFLPGEFHGQRSLAGSSPWGHKELDTAEPLTHTHTHISNKEAVGFPNKYIKINNGRALILTHYSTSVARTALPHKSTKSTQSSLVKWMDTFPKEGRRREESWKDRKLSACVTLESYL